MRRLNLRRASHFVAHHFAPYAQCRTYQTSLCISDEVRDAVLTNKPVVALETTIYTHGFPYPENIDLALNLESIVRRNGAVPATIGVLDGEPTVGLSLEKLTRLIEAAHRNEAMKVSRRDLAFACGSSLLRDKIHGGTTVSGTMVLAHLAGIDVLATGGIGGVHRGAESSMDISADLTELGRTPIAVISSGCKSFLDIPRTLEYLETQGVTVGTFQNGEDAQVDFPAFWSKESGLRSPSLIRSERYAAAMIHTQKSLPISSGMLLANPIPEESSISKANLDAIIEEAISDAERNGYTGKRNTPYILARIKELSKGETVVANRALIQNNVKMGAIVAKELCHIRNDHNDNASGIERHRSLSANTRPLSSEAKYSSSIPYSSAKLEPQMQNGDTGNSCDVLVAGSVALDYDCQYIASNNRGQTSPSMHTSNPSKISQNIGGVGYNITRAVQVAGSPVRLVSAVGDDPAGHSLLSYMKKYKLSVDGVKMIPGASTSLYIAFNNVRKDLIMATSDMRIFDCEGEMPPLGLWKAGDDKAKPSWVIIDANWSSSKIHKWFRKAKMSGAKTAFEPVSVPKAPRIFGDDNNLPTFPSHIVDIISPNRDELLAMYNAARSSGLFEREDWWQVISSFGFSSSGIRDILVRNSSAFIVDSGYPQQCLHLLPFFPTIAMKLGSDGLLLTILLKAGDARLSPTHKASQWVIRNASYAGNTSNSNIGGIYMRRFEASEVVPTDDVVSVNGIGDTMLGTLVSKLAQNDNGAEEFIEAAQQAAVRKLKCQSPFNTGLPD